MLFERISDICFLKLLLVFMLVLKKCHLIGGMMDNNYVTKFRSLIRQTIEKEVLQMTN